MTANAGNYGIAKTVRKALNSQSESIVTKKSFQPYFSVFRPLLPPYALNNSMFTPPG